MATIHLTPSDKYEALQHGPVKPKEHPRAGVSSDAGMGDPFSDASVQEDGKSGVLREAIVDLRRGFYRDFLKRDLIAIDGNEKFLNPYDGCLSVLIVQCSQHVQTSNPQATWHRTELKNGSPWMIRISNWAMAREIISEDIVRTNISIAAVKWIPACIALACVVGSNLKE